MSRIATQQGGSRQWPEWTALAAYVATVAFAIHFHEPWADEAQGWQIARSVSIPEIFRTYSRYEGSPGLWYSLLWILQRLRIGYTEIHWICGAITVAGVFLLIFRAPLPRYLRLLLPFTYFLLFQYSVIARCYVLIPPLLFLIAHWWKHRPVAVLVLLGVLANLSLHGAVISGGLAVAYGIQLLRSKEVTNAQRGRRLLGAFGLLITMYCFAAWTAWPPHDVGFARVRGATREFVPQMIASLVAPVCQPWPLSLVFWIVLAAWLFRRKRPEYLLPVVLFGVFSGAVYANWWHEGLLIPLVISLLWICWPSPGNDPPNWRSPIVLAVLIMALTQIAWSAYALYIDHYRAYSPDKATAEYLRPFVERGETIALTYGSEPAGNQAFDATGVLPYFNHSIYINQPEPFWSWKDSNPTEERFNDALTQHPTLVLLTMRNLGEATPAEPNDAKTTRLHAAGYVLDRTFCGGRPERLSIPYVTCHLIYRRQAGRDQ